MRLRLSLVNSRLSITDFAPKSSLKLRLRKFSEYEFPKSESQIKV